MKTEGDELGTKKKIEELVPKEKIENKGDLINRKRNEGIKRVMEQAELKGRTEVTQDFIKIIDDKKLLEKLAELEHNQWAVWTLYFLNHLTCKDLIEKWKFQMVTKYSDLSEKDKEKDRVWARKIIEELKQKLNEKK